MQKDDGGKEVRPLERSFSCGPDWVETGLPFVVNFDSPAGEAKLSIRFGGAVQVMEIADITLINCGPVDIATLPRTQTRYEGHAADAPWRAAAAARIEKYRKGDLTLHVPTWPENRLKALTSPSVCAVMPSRGERLLMCTD